MKISCLIVDDEQLAREMLEAYITRISNLKLVDMCKSTIKAKQVLEKNLVDLIFLDIQLPQQNGIDFWAQLPKPRPKVIFTTAYPNYALQGFELEALDYLLKPISFDRFQQAVEKAVKHLEIEKKAAQFDYQNQEKEQYIIVHSKHKHYKIFLNNIIYIESLKEYVLYHTTEGRIIELNSMKNLEKNLPSQHFLRIHRSYIVAIGNIQSYDNKNLTLPTSVKLPIGKTYKKIVAEKLFK